MSVLRGFRNFLMQGDLVVIAIGLSIARLHPGASSSI